MRVLYLDEENGERELLRRYKKLDPHGEITESATQDLIFVVFKHIKINHPNGKHRLEEVIKKFRPDVVIVDSLIRVFVGDENASKDIRTIFDAVKSLITAYDTTWIFLHHVTKNRGHLTIDDIRGSGDIIAQMSNIFLLSKLQENLYRLEQAKCRNSQGLEKPIEFSVSDEPNGGIKIEYKGEGTKQISVVEYAAQNIQEWIEKEGKQEFKSGEAYKHFEKSHDNNAIRDGLKLLGEKGFLISTGRGKWRKAL